MSVTFLLLPALPPSPVQSCYDWIKHNLNIQKVSCDPALVTFLFIPALPPSQVICDPALVTFLFIPALPPSQVICDPALVTFLFIPPKLYSGPTIQSRSAARRAAQDLVS